MASIGNSLAPAVRAVAGSRAVFWPSVFTVVASVAIGLSGIRGADYPAQLLRAELWERAGTGMWNYWWYGGHPTPSYSVLVPPMVAAVGAVAVCAIASVVATYVFARLVEALCPVGVSSGARLLATLMFAACAVVNVIVGRTTFAVGMATGLIAAWWWYRDRLRVALAFAALTPFTSPIVGAFLALVAAAVGLDALWARDRRRFVEGLLVGLCAGVPLAVIGLLFPDGGRFPFRGDQLVFSLCVMALTAAVYRNRAVRIGLALAAISSVGLFLIPNPMGGNFLRFTQFIVVPLGVVGVATLDRSRTALAAGAIVLSAAIWSVQYGVVAAVQWAGDDSVSREFHEPLIAELLHRNADGEPVGRVEIPFTDNHWEAYYVASEVPYARGWERQTDLERNPELYDPELTRTQYHDWLLQNAVRWVAVPDAQLDEGGLPEAEVLRAWETIPWLSLVWRNSDWLLYEIEDYVPIVDAPARLVLQRPDELVLTTDRPALVRVRYEYADELAISGAGCLIPPLVEGDWMRAFLPGPGLYRIGPDPEGLLPGVAPDDCRTTQSSEQQGG